MKVVTYNIDDDGQQEIDSDELSQESIHENEEEGQNKQKSEGIPDSLKRIFMKKKVNPIQSDSEDDDEEK